MENLVTECKAITAVKKVVRVTDDPAKLLKLYEALERKLTKEQLHDLFIGDDLEAGEYTAIIDTYTKREIAA